MDPGRCHCHTRGHALLTRDCCSGTRGSGAAAAKAWQRQLSLALLERGQTFKAVWEECVAKNPGDMGSPIKID